MKKNVQVGDVVLYQPNGRDKELMGEWRRSRGDLNMMDVIPAIVTSVWGPNCVNLTVICDGEGSMWRTSVQKGNLEGQWTFKVEDEYPHTVTSYGLVEHLQTRYLPEDGDLPEAKNVEEQ